MIFSNILKKKKEIIISNDTSTILVNVFLRIFKDTSIFNEKNNCFIFLFRFIKNSFSHSFLAFKDLKKKVKYRVKNKHVSLKSSYILSRFF